MAQITLEATLKEVACNNFGRNIVYNPDAALQRVAQLHGFGAPLTGEMRIQYGDTLYITQGFCWGILFTTEGHYESWEIQQVFW